MLQNVLFPQGKQGKHFFPLQLNIPWILDFAEMLNGLTIISLISSLYFAFKCLFSGNDEMLCLPILFAWPPFRYGKGRGVGTFV